MKALIGPLLTAIILCGCFDDTTTGTSRDYSDDMRTLVIRLSRYARNVHPGFIVIPQNGIELVTLDGEPDSPLVENYLDAIDGVGQEDLNYGYDYDDEPTPTDARDWLLPFLRRVYAVDKSVLAIDYCSTIVYMDDSYRTNENEGFISFAADHRELDNIPSYPFTPYHENSASVNELTDARNFLYLINPQNFATTEDFVATLDATNYDMMVIDVSVNDSRLTADQVERLQTKPDGSRRLVIAYLSIGEAENYRDYWQTSWNTNPPSWIADENPDWPGDFKVRYWDPEWQAILYGNDDACLDRILEAGFDGMYLDIIDAFEYFE
jgi:cysteinyl-tRNA synthetase